MIVDCIVHKSINLGKNHIETVVDGRENVSHIEQIIDIGILSLPVKPSVQNSLVAVKNCLTFTREIVITSSPADIAMST